MSKLIELARTTMGSNEPEELSWDWGPAMLLLGLLKFSKTEPQLTNECLEYVDRYLRWYLRNGLPRVNWSDRCAGGLVGHGLRVCRSVLMS